MQTYTYTRSQDLFQRAANVIPCGIYGDETRFTLLSEHITTIEKSMDQINTLAQSGDNANQLARWVTNKENHADEIIHIATHYILAQRIRLPKEPTDKTYQAKLASLHELIVHAMKAKQSTDLAVIGRLRDTLAGFKTLYIGASDPKGSGGER